MSSPALPGEAEAVASAAPYSSSAVYLFLGGFVLALAIQRRGLDRRIAFVTLRLMGTTPGRLVAGMLATCAFLSMWISNTAAAAMMVPIAIAVVDLVLRTKTGRAFDPKKGIPAERDRLRHRPREDSPDGARRLHAQPGRDPGRDCVRVLRDRPAARGTVAPPRRYGRIQALPNVT